MTLRDFFCDHPKAALGFSGGVDSAYLLAAATELGADVKPYFVKTPFQPDFELEDAKRLAPNVTVLELPILDDPAVCVNHADRCYHCKKAIFDLLQKQALKDGYTVLLDGTNASDDLSDRPGVRALLEYGVCSPLRMCGMTKEQIRADSKRLGLFTWDKPAYACLATRIPTGTVIDAPTLCRIEAAEQAVHKLGYRDFRVRLFHGAARIQLKSEQFPVSAAAHAALRDAVAPYFDPVLLDLQER